MILKQGWWKTGDGRLVPDGDPDAAILAYPRYTEVPDATAERLGIPADAGLVVEPQAGQGGDQLDVDELLAELAEAKAGNDELRVELEDARRVLAERDAELAEAKAAGKPADKARAKPADKSKA